MACGAVPGGGRLAARRAARASRPSKARPILLRLKRIGDRRSRVGRLGQFGLGGASAGKGLAAERLATTIPGCHGPTRNAAKRPLLLRQ